MPRVFPFRIVSLIFLVLAVLPVTAQTSQARVYKWVDQNGNVNYSDRLPSEASASQREILNRDGVVIERLDLPRIDAATAAQRQEVLRSAQRDLALSVTFEDENALRQAHEERLTLLRDALAIARNNEQRLQLAFGQHEAHAASFSDAGKPVPVAVQRNLDQARHMLEEQQAEARKIEDRYAQAQIDQQAELQRYRQLAEGKR
jgi:hypothetical protein